MSRPPRVRAVAPGRVNLIGDHTDYMGGLVLPMAVQLATTVEAARSGDLLELTSAQFDGTARVPLPVSDPADVDPPWARYPAGVAAALGATTGLVGTIDSDVPPDAGLSSSAALEVATALALGFHGDPLELARRCRHAEQLATGVPCGIMDQLASAAGRRGHAMLIDCASETVDHVPVPEEVAIWVVHSGQERSLAASAYGRRRAECERAEAVLGPLPSAPLAAIDALDDAVARARARHVRTECDRVRLAARSLAGGDLATVGTLMVASHRSLRDDFEVSTPTIDSLVEAALEQRSVHGARLTGAGFGGCIVVLAEPTADLGHLGTRRWRVTPSDGARVSPS